MDKDWKSALSVQEFLDLKSNVEQEQKEKQFRVDDSRRKRVKRTTKKPLTVAVMKGKPTSNTLALQDMCLMA